MCLRYFVVQLLIYSYFSKKKLNIPVLESIKIYFFIVKNPCLLIRLLVGYDISEKKSMFFGFDSVDSFLDLVFRLFICFLQWRTIVCLIFGCFCPFVKFPRIKKILLSHSYSIHQMNQTLKWCTFFS